MVGAESAITRCITICPLSETLYQIRSYAYKFLSLYVASRIVINGKHRSNGY